MLTLKGKQILLRALEPEDLDFLYKLENDETIWEISETSTPYSRFILKSYLENSHKDIYEIKQLRLAISKYSGEVIGMIDLFDFNPVHKRAGVGIVILDEENRKKGYGAEALDLLIQYGFKKLQLHQLFAHVAYDNRASIQLFEKFGFVQTGVKKDWIFVDGVFKNELLFQLINHVHT